MGPVCAKLRWEFPGCRLCELRPGQLRLIRAISIPVNLYESKYGVKTHSLGSLGSCHSGIGLPFTREDLFSAENWDSNRLNETSPST